MTSLRFGVTSQHQGWREANFWKSHSNVNKCHQHFYSRCLLSKFLLPANHLRILRGEIKTDQNWVNCSLITLVYRLDYQLLFGKCARAPLPWVPEAFHVRFLVLVKSFSRVFSARVFGLWPTACLPKRLLEKKPLVPRVVLLPGGRNQAWLVHRWIVCFWEAAHLPLP